MDICIVGTGNVSTHLAPALQRAGHAVAVTRSRNLSALPPAALYIVAVKDDALPEVVTRMRSLTDAPIVHTAGSVSGAVVDGVLYPMQTFSKARAVDFASVHFFIEAGSPTVLAALRTVAESIVGPAQVHELDSEGRKRLHLAAVFACNFVNHCCTMAEDVLRPAGISFDVMLPLLDETVAKLHQLTPRQAQTGPAIRNDETVMNAHSQLLADRPDLQAIYDQLSASIRNTVPSASPTVPTASPPSTSAASSSGTPQCP